jgi:2-C-methyl-D-erythritol 2,4-cyclodiphosphate synthase
MYRIGIGNDTHRLVRGRPLTLGGVTIPSESGAEGHSDADALAHALIDAILGALADGDIGVHFPDRDPKWKNANSLQMLAHVARLIDEKGWILGNVDATIMIEKPRLRDYIEPMRKNLAQALNTHVENVSVKAKTAEGLDAVGHGEAVSAQAIALIFR